MKKSIKEKAKESALRSEKWATRPFTTNKKGYEEKVYNSEEQKNAEKSNLTNKKKSTSGGES